MVSIGKKRTVATSSHKSKKSAVHPASKGTVDSSLASLQSSLTGFDPSGSFLFVRGAAAKGWKVFDAVSKAVLMESSSSQVTSFSWISSSSSSSLNESESSSLVRSSSSALLILLLISPFRIRERKREKKPMHHHHHLLL